MDLMSLGVFALALVLAAGTPGPSIAALVARVISSGWRDVAPFLAAMWLGELIWLTCAVAGLSALAERFHDAFLALKYAGVLYLLWLAWTTWRAPVDDTQARLPERRSGRAMFLAGMAVTLGNPKIMVFYLALLPALIDLSAPGPGMWLAVSVVALACLVAVDLAWVVLAARARRMLRSPRAVRAANRVSATAMGGAAVAIATR